MGDEGSGLGRLWGGRVQDHLYAETRDVLSVEEVPLYTELLVHRDPLLLRRLR